MFLGGIEAEQWLKMGQKAISKGYFYILLLVFKNMFFAYDYHLFRIAAGFFNFKSFSANAKTFEASKMFVEGSGPHDYYWHVNTPRPPNPFLRSLHEHNTCLN